MITMPYTVLMNSKKSEKEYTLEALEMFRKLPPELRAEAISHLRDLAYSEDSQDSLLPCRTPLNDEKDL